MTNTARQENVWANLIQTHGPCCRVNILTMLQLVTHHWYWACRHCHFISLIKKLVIITSYETGRKEKKAVVLKFLLGSPNRVKVWIRFSKFWYRKMEIICFSIVVKTRKSEQTTSRRMCCVLASALVIGPEMKASGLGWLRYGAHVIKPCPMGKVYFKHGYTCDLEIFFSFQIRIISKSLFIYCDYNITFLPFPPSIPSNKCLPALL